MEFGQTFSVSTTVARDELPALITKAQDARTAVILTRHNKPVAAIVSMTELKRIWAQEEIDDIVKGRRKPAKFRLGKTGKMTTQEAAEEIQQMQMDRRMEREVLKHAGLEPIPGGELLAEVANTDAPPRLRKWWQFWRR